MENINLFAVKSCFFVSRCFVGLRWLHLRLSSSSPGICQFCTSIQPCPISGGRLSQTKTRLQAKWRTLFSEFLKKRLISQEKVREKVLWIQGHGVGPLSDFQLQRNNPNVDSKAMAENKLVPFFLVTRALGAPDNLYIFISSKDWNHHLLTSCGLSSPTARSVVFCKGGYRGLGGGGGGGVGGVITFFFLRSCQNSVPLHLPTCGMLRCRIFSCTCQHVGCYAAALANMLDVTLPLLALANMQDVTLPHLLLHLPTCRMLRCRISSCTCQHVGCHAAAFSLALANMLDVTLQVSSLALSNMRDVTLPHLLLHLPTCGMLRCRVFSCTCQAVGCQLPHLLLHLPTCWMLRCRIFSCTSQQLCHRTAKMRTKTNLVRKKSFGNDDVQNPLQILLKVCFGARPHGISLPFCK